MTIEEKRDYIDTYCDERWDEAGVGENACNNCPFDNHTEWCNVGDICDVPEDKLDGLIERIKLHNYCTIKEQKCGSVANDPVNPSHYKQEGQMECIDEMILLFGKEAVKHFCLCNAWKYRYRSNQKNGDEDLKKAAWYVHKYRELCGND